MSDKKKKNKKKDAKSELADAKSELADTSLIGEKDAPVKKGNDYPYSKFIKQPNEMDASTKGTMEALNKNVKALQGYVDVLISGDSKAQRGREPLGNKYFLDTGTSCTDSTGAKQPRHIYINNVPDGIPFIQSAMGKPMTGFRGLVPGVLNDLSYIDPSALFTSFYQGSDCQAVTMETRDIDNIKGVDTKYVLNDDIRKYPVWWFSDCKNPVTQEVCPEEKKKKKKKKEGMCVEDYPLWFYYAVSIVGVIFLYKSIKK
jgi:hypothetical protein